ncbi:MAG: hypothetical protein IKB20_02545 [Clostridia bacterium]|nr:hypothetical protein [Clostridia bacterium]
MQFLYTLLDEKISDTMITDYKEHMRLLTSSLQGVINALLNGQLAPQVRPHP